MLSSTLAIALVYCLQFCCRHHLAFYFKMAKLRNDVDDDVIFFIIELGINFFFSVCCCKERSIANFA